MSINQPAFLMITAAIISLLLAAYALRNKQNSGGIYLSLLLISASIWSFFYGMEIFTTDMHWMKIYVKVSYFGITSLSVFWLIFAARYSGFDRWISPLTIALLFVIPTIIVLMVITNNMHHLYYKSVETGELGSYTYLKLKTGPFWIVHIIYSHSMFIWGFILFVRLFFKIAKENRIHIMFIMGAALLPYLVNVLYVFGYRPFGFLDLTPVAFILMGLIISFGVITIKLFDINPLAVDLFFKNTKNAIFVRNTSGKIVNANPGAQDLLKEISSGAIFINENTGSFSLKENASIDQNEISQIKLKQQTYERSNTIIFSSNGKQIGILTVLRDITKTIETQIALEKQANLQRLLMNMASNYINLKIEDMENGINKSLREMGEFADADRAYIFDYNWENNTCSNTYEWCAAGITPEINNLQDIPNLMLPGWVEAHSAGKPLLIPDVFILPIDNSVRKILEPQGIRSLITIPIMDKNDCLGFMGFDFVRKYHNITENETSLLSFFVQILVNVRKRAELENNLIVEKEKANAANRAKSEFLANMSHEIRTPMNSILGFAEVVLDTTQDQLQKNYLKTILDNGKTLLSLINDILDLSKIEAGRMLILPEQTDIKRMIEELKKIFQHTLMEKNIDFKIEIDPKFPNTIIIDELRIRQILLNLIGNAVKFTHRGHIKIQIIVLNKTKETIDFEIKVIDTGIGIAKENYEYLFQSFNQQSGQKNRQYGGTGLGLAITKRLTELMNGTISITSKLNLGSTFCVRFMDVKSTDIVKSEMPSKNTQKIIKTEKLIIPEEIKVSFKEEFSKDIDSQTDSIIFEELNEMIIKMEKFASIHQIIPLQNKIDELKVYSDDYNFEKIQESLKSINKMVSN